jgi:transmembrane sensor
MSESNPLSRLNAESATDTAANWVARELAGKLLAKDREALDQWLSADDAHQSAYAEAWSAYASAGEGASHPALLAMRESALAQGAKPYLSQYWTIGALAVAATLAIAILAGPVRDALRPASSAPEVTATNETAPPMRDRYATGVGERLTATLEDGSVITLNTATEVRVHYRPRARRIELMRGQALVSVAHRPDWPFEVVAGNSAVRAIGTEFDVRLRDGALEVVLIEGRVAVGRTDLIEQGALDRVTQLEAGERLVLTSTAAQVSPVDTDIASSWRRGRVSFDNAPLPEALAEINRYRAEPILITDPRVASLSISGTYRTADAMRFEDTLAAAFNIDHQTAANGAVELSWRGDAAAP